MKVLPYRMFCPIRNLGDAINPYIIKSVTGMEPIFRKTGNHLLGVGSVFFYANNKSYIWGSGVIKPDQPIRSLTGPNVKAVRGKLTKDFLARKGYKFENLPLGDPGFLLRRYYPFREVEKKYSVCIIPHHSSYHSKEFDRFKGREDVFFFNIMTNNISDLDSVAASEIVVSQSLHGLIFAEAFGIPSVWISSRFDDRWVFKFLDWYSTTGEPWKKPLSLDSSLSDIIKEARLSYSCIDMDELEAAFPKDELAFDIDEHVIPYESCIKIDAVKVKCDFDFSFIEYDKLYSNDFKEICKALNERMKKVKPELYSAPPYMLLGQDVDSIKEDEVNKISRVMDSKLSFYFASVVKGMDPPEDDKVYSQDGVLFSKNKYIGRNFFLRPIRDIKFDNEEFLTFYLP